MSQARPFSLFGFTIAATGTGPNADAIVQAIRAAIMFEPRPVPLEIRAAALDGGEVYERVLIGLEITPPEIPRNGPLGARRAAFRICGPDGTIAGPGSHELARLELGLDTAAARLCYHLARLAFTRTYIGRELLDRPAPWIYYTGPAIPDPVREADPFPPIPAPGVYNASQVLELNRRKNLERALGDQSIRQMFDDMRHCLARIAVALGRSQDGSGFDCDWHELERDVEELAIACPVKIPRDAPPTPRAPYAGWEPGAAGCPHVVIVKEHCSRCGAKIPD